MTNLDDLKDAMAAPPDFVPRQIDLGSVMAAGGRVRRRRRLAVSAASGLAVVALLVGGAQFAGHLTAGNRGGPAQVANQGESGQPTSTGPASTPPTNTRPTTSPPSHGSPTDGSPTPVDAVLGDIIYTGINGWLLYASPIETASLPTTHFAVNLGLAEPNPNGTPTTVVTTNETEGSDRSTGFHAAEAAMNVNGKATLAFGYYVGAAKRITATADGRTVTAKHATWSEDPSVVFFWFSPGTGKLSQLTAYGSDGKKLEPGKNEVGAG